MKKVFITGGAGYVGSALVPKLLEKGFQVTVYDTYWYGPVFYSISDSNLNQIIGDIRDREKLRTSMAGHDSIIHLACISNDPSFELNPSLGKSINYDAFSNVLSSAKENKAERFIYASSSSVYGVKLDQEVTEELSPEPLTDYSKFKLECEKVLYGYSGDMEYVIIRPATVCGYAPRLRLDLAVNILTMNALENRKIKIFGGKQLRPNINIEDMVRVYDLMLSTQREKINRQVFNVGYENYSIEDIAKIVAKNVGGDLDLVYEESDDNRSYHINSDKIKKELEFNPQYSIDSAVKSIVDAYHMKLIHNGLQNPFYHNIKRMKELNIQ